MQKGTVLLYDHAKYDGDRGSRASCKGKKCDVFFDSLFVTLWNYEVCDNGSAIKQCNFLKQLRYCCIEESF